MAYQPSPRVSRAKPWRRPAGAAAIATTTAFVREFFSTIFSIIMLGAIALLLLASTVATATITSISQQPHNGRSQDCSGHHDHQQHNTGFKVRLAALAWGSRGDNSHRSNIDDVGHFTSAEVGEDVGSAAAFSDPSWTHAAFRAFHEMRAGAPPQSAAAAPAAAAEPPLLDHDRGILHVVRRKFSSLMPRDMSISTAAVDQAAEATAAAASREADMTTTPAQAQPACWHMKGRLTSTASGRTIALVEGVELSRSLAFEVAASDGRKSTFASRNGGGNGGGGTADSMRVAGTGSNGENGAEGELAVDQALRKPRSWTAFGALASSKFFMYQNPETGEPMETFRHTPVDKKMPVRTYERFSQVVSHLLQPNGRILVVSEWGGRSVKAETANINGVEEIGSDLGRGWGRRGGGGGGDNVGLRRVFNLHFFVEARTAKEERELKRRESRPGAKWIAFGATPPPSHGCREVYSYISGGEGGVGGGGGGAGKAKMRGHRDNSDVSGPTRAGILREVGGGGWRRRRGDGGGFAEDSGAANSQGKVGAPTEGLLTYTRYGECPSWYGTGQMCGLDVQAKRVRSFANLPDKLKKRVLDVDPTFESGLPRSLEECRVRVALEKKAREEERRKRRRSWRWPLGTWGSRDE